MQEKKPIYKIYSRNRLKVFNKKNRKYKVYKKRDIKSFIVFLMIIFIAIIYLIIYKSINPIFETICIDEAQAIATKITNEESTKLIQKYNYNDMFNIQKDESRKYTNDKCKCFYYKSD